jgi:hypothetical protein
LTSRARKIWQRVLNLLIDQRLISQEAGKLPTITPSDADVDKATNELVKRFPSQAAFYERLARVGLTGEGLREIVRQRVEIENYLNFRFRSFTIISTQEIADYYRDVYVPRHRRQSPGRIVPTLEQATADIERTLTEDKIESDTDASSKTRAPAPRSSFSIRYNAEVRGQRSEVSERQN